MKPRIGVLFILFFSLEAAFATGNATAETRVYRPGLDSLIAKGRYSEAYEIVTALDPSSGFYEKLSRLTVKEINGQYQRAFERDRSSLKHIARKMMLGDLQFLRFAFTSPVELNLNVLEATHVMTSARKKTVEARSALMSQLAIHGASFFRCELNYYSSLFTFKESIDKSYKGPDTQFCAQFSRWMGQDRALVVLVDLLSAGDRFATCRRQLNSPNCYERSSELYALHGVKSEQDKASILSLIQDDRSYNTSLFKPFGYEFETGAGEKLPIYCIAGNLRLVRPSGFNTSCELRKD